MKKKQFEQPEMEIIQFDKSDVITSSGGTYSTTNIFEDVFNLYDKTTGV
ncbi:MAG: hypothetical protein ACI4MQ_07975 [Candidatus Coproplasma sp.]